MTSKIFVNNLSINANFINGGVENTIVFIHGNSCSSEIWKRQLEDSDLINSYRLIAFDLPGHGESGWSNDTEEHYSLKGISSFVQEIFNQVDLKKFIVVGFSLGSNIIGEIAENLRDCCGIVLTGTAIASKEFPPSDFLIQSPFISCFVEMSPPDDQLEGYARILFHNADEASVKMFKKMYLKTDPAFRATMGKVIANGEYSDEIENLKNANLPICIITGKNEAIVNPDYLDSVILNKWQDKIFKLDNCGHAANWDQPEVFNNILLNFASSVLK